MTAIAILLRHWRAGEIAKTQRPCVVRQTIENRATRLVRFLSVEAQCLIPVVLRADRKRRINEAPLYALAAWKDPCLPVSKQNDQQAQGGSAGPRGFVALDAPAQNAQERDGSALRDPPEPCGSVQDG